MRALRKSSGMHLGLSAIVPMLLFGARFILRTAPELALYGVTLCRGD